MRIQFQIMSLVVAATVLTGCALWPSHIHNEGNAQTAKKAEAEMAASSTNAPAIYGAMSANLELFKVQEEYVLSELGASFQTALATKLPSLTWGELRREVQSRRADIEKFATQVALEARTFSANDANLEAKLAAANKALKDANTQVSDAKKAVAAWNETVAAFQVGIANTGENLGTLNKQATFDQLKTVAANVGTNSVVYADADGKSQTNTVAGVLKSSAENVFKVLTSKDKDSMGKPLLPDAPGIGLVIANMALDVAEFQKEDAEQRLSHLTARAHLFEDAYAEMRLAQQLLKDVDLIIGTVDHPTTSFPDRKTVYEETSYHWVTTSRGLQNAMKSADAIAKEDATSLAKTKIDALAKEIAALPKEKADTLLKEIAAALPKEIFDALASATAEAIATPNAEPSAKTRAKALALPKEIAEVQVHEFANTLLTEEDFVANQLVVIRKTMVAESIVARNIGKFETSLQRLRHQDSIANSAIADAAWRALLKSALAGLSAYHQGGATKEDVANLISFCQAVALAVVAYGVN